MNTTLKIVGDITEILYLYTVHRLNHSGRSRPAQSKSRYSTRPFENIPTATATVLLPLMKFTDLDKRMVSSTSVSDAHPPKRVNRNIWSVKPPRGVSKPSRSQEFLKVF